MAEVTMPRLSDTMEEGTIASWLKQPGEQISKGEVIAQIETDKATMDLTAFEAGTLQEILAPEGATVPIGQPVARIGSGAAAPAGGRAASAAPPEPAPDSTARPESAPDSTAPSAATASAAAGESSAASALRPSEPPDSEAKGGAAPKGEAAAPNAGEGEEPTASAGSRPESPDGAAINSKTRASPMARHIAAEHGLDLGAIRGSGPQGRIIRADVQDALSSTSKQPAATAEPPGPGAAPDGTASQPAGVGEAAPPAAGTAAAQPSAPEAALSPSSDADDERVNLSQMRRTIARRMAEATRTVPHFFLTTTVDASEMVKLRKQLMEQIADAGIKITFNDLVVKGAALALRKVPEVNVSFAEDSLIRHKRVHIGVAVATERGLIVPVLRDVDSKSLGQIARETRDLAERANAGKLQPADYSGGTFTISNLGMFGVEQFSAVINPPESAILAVGAITREPAEHDGQIALRDRLKLTLSVDHRALDGAIGARYLQALKQLLEKPMLLLV